MRLAFVALLLTGCVAPADSSPEAPAPRYEVRVKDLLCTQSKGGMAIAEGTVENVGDRLELLELSVRFEDGGKFIGNGAGYADVAPLHPGQVSTYRILGPSIDYTDCALTQATTRYGQPVVLGQ